ncbi:hypothetical protein PBY51_018136 [Eleginops maclovinus]|uniref:Uncharacterized protein n=1 Tax=Eleginops maclovinus TaxID=56733 RepID=A0AAN7XKE4_ELEMC|nr:hypothetical protein PBY51_018136 [Eleginops maclovinus]
MNVMRTLPRLLSDTGQKKTPEKKDGRRMSFQRPKGTIEYSVSKAQATELFRCNCLHVFLTLLPYCCSLYQLLLLVL